MIFDELNQARAAMLDAAHLFRQSTERHSDLERLIMSTSQELKDSFAAVEAQAAANNSKIDAAIALLDQLVAGITYPMSQEEVDALKARADALSASLKGEDDKLDAALAADTPPAPPAPAPAPVEAPPPAEAPAPAPAADTAAAS